MNIDNFLKHPYIYGEWGIEHILPVSRDVYSGVYITLEDAFIYDEETKEWIKTDEIVILYDRTLASNYGLVESNLVSLPSFIYKSNNQYYVMDSEEFLPIKFYGKINDYRPSLETFKNIFNTIATQSFNFTDANEYWDSVIENPFIAILYQYVGEKNVIHKSSNLQNPNLIAYQLNDSCNILNPSLLIDTSDMKLVDYIMKYNYIYIPLFERYYYITDIVAVRNYIWQIDCKVDVLMTYNSDIIQQDGLILRNEYEQNLNIADERLPLENKPSIDYILPTDGDLVNLELTTNLDNKEHIVLSTINDTSIQDGELSNANNPSSTTLPSVNRKVGNNPISTNYVMTYDKFKKVAYALRDNDALSSFVISAIAYPFDVLNIEKNSTLVTSYEVRINKTSILENPPQASPILTSPLLSGTSSKYLIIADFTYNGAETTTYRNYEPFSNYEIYIPFVGWNKINAIDFINKRCIVYYVVDYTTGDGQVFVYNVTNNKIILSNNIQLGIKLSTSTSNHEELNRAKISNGLNALIGGVTSALLLSNPLTHFAGILSSIQTGFNFINNNVHLIERGNVNVNGDRIGLYNPYKVYIRRTYNKIIGLDYDVYKHLNGLPTNIYDNITDGQYAGYTEIVNMHYKPIDKKFITTNEIDEIISLAEKGIII